MAKVRAWLDHRFNRLINRLAEIVAHQIFSHSDQAQVIIEQLLPQLSLYLATTPIVFGGSWDKISLGEGVKLVNTLLNVSSGNIRIGSHTFFGHNVCLLTGTHDIYKTLQERQAYPTNGHDIVIGEGVWIATNATVIGPCVIGDHAVIAAGSLVLSGELESGCLYAGVPARKIRNLISDDGPASPPG